MGGVTGGIYFFLYTLLLLTSFGPSANQAQVQPNPCSPRRNDCFGFMYCHNDTSVCTSYGTTKLGGKCTTNGDCGGEYEYCHRDHKNCSCIFGQLNGPSGGCVLPVEGTECNPGSPETKLVRRGPNDVDECQGKGSTNFRCHYYARICYCVAKHNEIFYDGAAETRKQDAWFNPETRRCEAVPKEGDSCGSPGEVGCQTEATKMTCIDSKCTCPTGLVQYGGFCRKVAARDICQGVNVDDYNGGTCPPGTQRDLFCEESVNKCRCRFLEGYLGEGVPERIGSNWNASSGNCEWGPFEEKCWYNKYTPERRGVKHDTCDNTKGLRCRQRGLKGGFKCLCHENYDWEPEHARCPRFPGEECERDDQCYKSKKCDRGICVCPKGESGNWSLGFKRCIPCDYDPYGDCPGMQGGSALHSFAVLFGSICLLASLLLPAISNI